MLGEVYQLEIYMEGCCDICNDIIHNHFDCPICKTDYAETNIYGALYDLMTPDDRSYGYKYLECGKCDAKFEPLDYSELYYGDWRLVEKNVSIN